jgi:molecular chaperone DnaJ
MSKDYYKILGVDRNSSESDIKSAYKKLAFKYHPDKNGGSKESEEKFKEIQEAYSVLSDTNKKSKYDGGGFNMDDIFGGFGGFGGFDFDIFGRDRNRQKKGEDIKIKVSVTLNDILFGTLKKTEYRRGFVCKTCNGLGGSGIETCNSCGGSGRKREVRMTPFGRMVTEVECDSCGGTGKTVKHKCNDCGGTGIVYRNESIDIQIPKGAIGGSYMKMAGFGSEIPDGVNGDLYIIIEEIPDSNFIRKDLDLIYKCKISVLDAILGCEKELKLPDGSNFKFKISGGTNHGKIYKIGGKGIKDINYGSVGDILIEVELVVPKSITENDRNILLDLSKSESFKV